VVGKEKNPSLLAFRVILTVLTMVNMNMMTKLPYHPPVLRERGLNKKNKGNKQVIFWCQITIYSFK